MKETFPVGMEEYLSRYGWHFSKKMCEWAVGKMTKRGTKTEHLKMHSKEDVENVLKSYGIDVSKYIGYDAVYVFHMAKADYLGSSINDDRVLSLFVKDYLEDPDGYDEIAFTRFYADCIGKGEMPEWEDVL